MLTLFLSSPLGRLTAFLLFLTFAFSFEKVGGPRRARTRLDPPFFWPLELTQGLAYALWDRVRTEVGLPKPWASTVTLKEQTSEQLENLHDLQSNHEALELGSPATL